MNRLQNILIVFLTVLTASCSIQQKTTLKYGTEDRLLIYYDSTFSNGKVTFKVNELTFYFKTENFRNTIIKNYDVDFEAYAYLKDFYVNYLSNEELEITHEGNKLVINGTKTNFQLSYDINFIMDYLIKEGDFYLKMNNKPIQYIEYKYWDPQYMGTIYSEWIVNKKVIYEFVHGFVE